MSNLNKQSKQDCNLPKKQARLQSTKIAQVKEERPESVVQKEGEECRGNLAPLEAPEDKACQEGLGSQESPENLAGL